MELMIAINGRDRVSFQSESSCDLDRWISIVRSWFDGRSDVIDDRD